MRRLPGRPADWDRRIAAYDTKTLFHESAWLDHILSIHEGSRIDYYEILRGEGVVGHFCAYRIRKGGLPIYGSPLGGTGTNFMGPLVSKDLDQGEVVDALVRLMGARSCLHVELSNPWLRRPLMEARGFQVHEDVTHLVRLPDTEEDAWQTLKSTARNRVRKAQANELVVERVASEDLVDQYMEQYQEVFGKQGMRVPYGRDRVVSLFSTLLPVGRLLALRVRRGDEVMATGFFPYDERCIYFWGATSWLKHQAMCPNELLHWEVIRSAVAMGIPRYNMCGGRSRFKAKFGGEDVPYLTFSKSAIPGMSRLRSIYRWWHFHSLKRK